MNFAVIAAANKAASVLGIDLMRLMPLASLADVKSSDLTLEHLKTISDCFGLSLPIDDDMLSKVVAHLRDGNINALADLVQHPDQFTALANFLKGSETVAASQLFVCPHCAGMFS